MGLGCQTVHTAVMHTQILQCVFHVDLCREAVDLSTAFFAKSGDLNPSTVQIGSPSKNLEYGFLLQIIRHSISFYYDTGPTQQNLDLTLARSRRHSTTEEFVFLSIASFVPYPAVPSSQKTNSINRHHCFFSHPRLGTKTCLSNLRLPF